MKSNKYNILAIRRELDNHVRNNAWKKFQSKLKSLEKSMDLLQSVVLSKSSSKSSSSQGGTLLHAILMKKSNKNNVVAEVAISIALAVPQSLQIQDSRFYTPLHLVIARDHPTMVLESFLTILKEQQEEDQERVASSDHQQHNKLSVSNILSTSTWAGDTPLLLAAREDNHFIPFILRHASDNQCSSCLSFTLVEHKRKNRTALWYMVSNELQCAYKFKQYTIPREVGLVLMATYFATIQQEQEQQNKGINVMEEEEKEVIPQRDWEIFQQELLLQQEGMKPKTPNEEEARLALLLRALVSCSHLMGKYAVKLLDFVLENDTYKDLILSKAIDQHGNYLLHHLCTATATATSNQTTAATVVLLMDQLKSYKPQFATAVRSPNRDDDLPLHLALTNYHTGCWSSGSSVSLIRDLIQACPQALHHPNRRGELPIHIYLKNKPPPWTTTTKMCLFLQIMNELWINSPAVVQVRDGPTQMYPFQLASCCECMPLLLSSLLLSSSSLSSSDNDDATTSRSNSSGSGGKEEEDGDAHWVNAIFTLLLAAPQVISR